MIKVNPLLVEVSEGAEFYTEVPRRNERLNKRIQEPGGRQEPEEINSRKLGCALTVTQPENWHWDPVLQLHVKQRFRRHLVYMEALQLKLAFICLVTL